MTGESMSGERVPRICVPILASHNLAVYRVCHDVWSRYMNRFANVECFFIYGDPDMAADYERRGRNELWVKCLGHSVVPGLLEKTLLALRYLRDQRAGDFDYVLSANMSSFFLFDRLTAYLQANHEHLRTGCYHGVIGTYGDTRYVSGSGFLMSWDVAMKVHELEDEARAGGEIQDVAIGRALGDAGIRATLGPRHNFTNDRMDGIDAALEQLDRAEPLMYHFRVKNERDRDRIDPFVYQRLLARYYDEDLEVPSSAALFIAKVMRRARRVLRV
jgi:hypothetical protein